MFKDSLIKRKMRNNVRNIFENLKLRWLYMGSLAIKSTYEFLYSTNALSWKQHYFLMKKVKTNQF